MLPHVAEGGHQTLIRAGFDAHYREFRGVGGYTDRELPPIGTGARTILDGGDPAYGRKALGVFQTSDCRRADFRTLGSHTTWVKWSKPTAEALRQSCLARHSRISQTAPQLPSVAITRIEISASKFLGKQNVFLSPQYNALIGGRGTGKSTLLEYARWALCVPTRGNEDVPPPEYERRARVLIENTLGEVRGAVRVHVDVRGVEHVVERRTHSDDARIILKVGDDEFRSSDEEEIRRLLPVEAYSQKQLSSIGGDASDVLRFVLAPVARAVASIDDDIKRASDAIQAAFAQLRTTERAAQEAGKLRAERESLVQQRASLQEGFVGLDPEDAATLRAADGYSAERSVRDRWRGEIAAARDTVEKARASVAGLPAEIPTKPDLPDADVISSMRAQLAGFFDSLRAQVDQAISGFDISAELDSFRVLDATLDERLGAARERFKAARERAAAHENAIKQVEALTARIAEIDDRLGPLERSAQGAAEAAAAFDAAGTAWAERLRARGAITAERCALIAERSRRFVRAEVRVACDLSVPMDHLQEVARGTRIRGERFAEFGMYLDAQPDPLDVWIRATEELRGLIGIAPDDATLPPCPILHAGGFADKELRALAARLSDGIWLALRAAMPADAVRFEYKAREGEFISFADASAGQRATALMRALLADEGAPLIIDQPEDDLDNKVIHEIASDIWRAKSRRQLVFASHNANLVVNGDADLVVVFDYGVAGEQTSGVIAAEGAIDDKAVRDAITDVMEGGRDAFRLRAGKYGF